MRKFDTWDVFTDEKLAGNALAVVMDAEGLSSDQMLAITREFNLSETTFILPPADPDNTARVRIFTLGYEMPFAGHPTIGAAIAIAEARGLAGPLRLELQAGLFPVDVRLDGDRGWAEFQNPNLPRVTGEAPGPGAIARALSLPEGAIDGNDSGGHAPRLVGAGVDFLYARASLDHVRAAKLNQPAFDALGIEQAVGVYLYAEGGDGADASWHARMFAPHAGIPEDPATGSAAAAFPGQIVRGDPLADGEHRWLVEQGFEMGRPSRIHIRTEIRNGAVAAVWISGAAVRVQRGALFV